MHWRSQLRAEVPKVGANILTMKRSKLHRLLYLAPCYGQQSKSTVLSFVVAKGGLYSLHTPVAVLTFIGTFCQLMILRAARGCTDSCIL
jgi:hypothetical protein